VFFFWIESVTHIFSVKYFIACVSGNNFLHLMGFRNCCWCCQSRKKLKEKKTKWKWKLWSFAEATKCIFVYISIYLAIKKLKCIWNMFY